jgi:hypothetical protein
MPRIIARDSVFLPLTSAFEYASAILKMRSGYCGSTLPYPLRVSGGGAAQRKQRVAPRPASGYLVALGVGAGCSFMAFRMLFPTAQKAPPTAAHALLIEASWRGISGKNVRELMPLLKPLITGFVLIFPL